MRRHPPTAAPTAEVERLLCASLVAGAAPSYAELERIRQQSVKRNLRHDIHAALLCQSGWYVHWMEGPGEAVRALQARLLQDPRHHAHRLLHHSRGQRYLLARWSMMLHGSTEPTASFGQRVHALAEARERGLQYPPTSVLRRLSAPLRLRPASDAEGAEQFHRVGVCSAEDGRSFELVRWLADRQGVAPYLRRVAGEHDLDSASDYVEFLEDGAPCRVIAVSRAGLQHGLRRAFLPDWPHLLLLFGTDARRNSGLMDRVREACQGLPGTPLLLGVAADVPVHARMIVAARAAGLKYHMLGVMRPEAQAEVWQAVRERLRQAGPPANLQWDLTHPGWVP